MTSFAFGPSGELIPPTEKELLEADKDSAILCYTDGLLDDGRPYYAYIAVKPSRYKEFKKITDAGEGLTFSDYGEVIAFGFEAKPPGEVVQEMREKYGFDEEYTEKLVQRIREEQAAFLEQQEKKRLDDIVQMLKKKQNGDEKHTEELVQRTREEQTALLGQQEKNRLDDTVDMTLKKKQNDATG